MASPLSAATEAVQQDFANFEPQNAGDLEGLFTDMPNFFEEFTSAISTLADKMQSDMPLHPEIGEHVREMTGVLAGLKDHSDELNGMFQTLHAKELERIHNPRPAEEIFDVANQD